MRDTVCVPVECRASTDGPRLRATVIQEGRASRGVRAEVFAPGALAWSEDGIAIRTVHLGPEETRAVPERLPDGQIVIDAPATPAIFKAVQNGARYASIEFQPGGRDPHRCWRARGNVGAPGRRGACAESRVSPDGRRSQSGEASSLAMSLWPFSWWPSNWRGRGQNLSTTNLLLLARGDGADGVLGTVEAAVALWADAVASAQLTSPYPVSPAERACLMREYLLRGESLRRLDITTVPHFQRHSSI